MTREEATAYIAIGNMIQILPLPWDNTLTGIDKNNTKLVTVDLTNPKSTIFTITALDAKSNVITIQNGLMTMPFDIDSIIVELVDETIKPINHDEGIYKPE